MKTKNYLWSLLTIMMVAMLSVSMISCGGDDDDDFTPNSGGGSSTNTGDYIATTQVKTMKVKDTGANFGWPIIYEDYNKKYELGCSEGRCETRPYIRKDGGWKLNATYNSFAGVGIESVGKVSGLSQITTYCMLTSTSNFPDIQPNCGYAVQFETESGEWKHLRIYVKDYTLDSKGSLETVTYQYQLY